MKWALGFGLWARSTPSCAWNSGPEEPMNPTINWGHVHYITINPLALNEP